MFSERKQSVLQSLIQEYVVSAHPVASSTLVRYYLPRLSSATVRNELMWLEEHGYVVSPHTSAGRMPTTVGYRSFVNSLLLRPVAWRISQERRLALELQDALLEPQDALAPKPQGTFVSKSQGAFAPTAPTAESSFLRVGLAKLGALGTLGATADKVALITEVLGLMAELNRCLVVLWAHAFNASLLHRGLPLLLSQPEFAHTASALPIMQLLEDHGELAAIFEDVMSTGGLHIKIGSEHEDAQLYRFSLVTMRFDCQQLLGTGVSNQAVSNHKGGAYGVLALFGPTRMDYERAIGSLSSMVRELEQGEW